MTKLFQFYEFDQTEFLDGEGMDEFGFLYVPTNCMDKQTSKIYRDAGSTILHPLEVPNPNPLQRWNIFAWTMETKLLFQIEIIISVSFCIIWIPMLWVYGNYTFIISFSVGTDFRRQDLSPFPHWKGYK